MPGAHDPLQFTSQLRQILSADKLSVGFFLGAGCPCAVRVPVETEGETRPIIPDIAGLTKNVLAGIQTDEEVKDAMTTLIATFADDEQPEPNIEAILNRLRSYHAVAGKSGVRGLMAKELAALDVAICRLVKRAVTARLPDERTPYESLAEYIGFRSAPHVELFTTNYDLLTEQALERHRVPFFDGFIGADRAFFDIKAIEENEIPPRWSRLWKLHGSVNWRIDRVRKTIFRTEAGEGDDLLIHPSHLKYDESRRMPYYVMIDRFRGFIRRTGRPVVLLICGYSFGDEHINNALTECLDANPSAACFALQYNDLAKYPAAVSLAKTQLNLSVLARDQAIIRGMAGNWMLPANADVAALAGGFELTSEVHDEEAPRPCVMTLGDFAALGRFLDEFRAALSMRAIAT